MQKIIVENEQEIIEGISRNFYRVIKRGLYEQALQKDYYYPGSTSEKYFLEVLLSFKFKSQLKYYEMVNI